MNSTLGRLGHVLGTGLTAGLNQLAQNKIDERLRSDNELLRKKEIKSAADYLIARGLSENDAYAAASIEDKDIRKKVFEDINKIPFGRDESQQSNPMQSMTGLGEPQAQQPQVAPQQQASPQQAAPEAAPQPVATAQPSGGKSLGRIFTIGKQAGEENPNIERRHQEKLAQDKELVSYKETKEERLNAVHKAQSAKEDLRSLERFEELEKEGNLDTPGYLEFLNRSGLDISALKNPSSQEFEKLQSNFLKNAKEYFGGRISNYEIEQFLKTIPTLSQSPEGRKRVITNLKYIARGQLLHYDAMKEVIKENKGIPPLDLVEKTYDKTEKKMEGLSDKFREELKKPVPKGQNKLITALQSAVGSIAGSPIVQGAALGAGIGAAGGPIGIGGGALLGASKTGFDVLKGLLK